MLISDRNDFIDFFISGTVSSVNARDDRVKLYNEKFVNKKIQSFTLDEWTKNKNLDGCSILKLDIEGSEIRALTEAKKELENNINFVKVEFNYHSKKIQIIFLKFIVYC